jgi:lipopolysaccharide export system permease protein
MHAHQSVAICIRLVSNGFDFLYDPTSVPILHRYILREITVPFILGLGIFTLILLVARVLKLADLVVNRGVPMVEILRLFTLILPAFLEITIPMAMLLGVLIAFGRLSSESELIALTASGVSIRRLMVPVLILGCAAGTIALSVSLHGKPWANKRMRETLYELAKKRATAGIREKVFNNEFEGLVIYVEQISGKGSILEGILISDSRDEQTIIVARHGYVITNEDKRLVTLRLEEGSLHNLYDAQKTYHRTDFATYDLNLDLGTVVAPLRAREAPPGELSLSELLATIATKESAGDNALPWRVELHRKFALSFASVLFAALGVPLGIRPTRAVHSRGFATSLGVIFSYYLFLTLGESLGNRGALPPALALWLPNFILTPVSVALIVGNASPLIGRPSILRNLVNG